MPKLIDLTAKITESEEMANHPAHGRSPVFLTGTRMNHSETEDTMRGKGVEDLSLMNGFVLLAEHNGTHVDAPVHFHPNGRSIEKIPLERCCGSAVWLDVSAVGSRGLIGPTQLETAQDDANVTVSEDDCVLLYTGWDNYIPNDIGKYHDKHPGLSAEGAEWLHDRDVSLVGTDCGNIDVAGDVSFPAHRVFLRRDIGDKYTLVVENLRNINTIAKHRFKFVAAPLPLEGSTASPVRAFAQVE